MATMRKLLSTAAILGAVLAAATSLPAAAADNWKGAGVMAGGKGYATTPMGQVDYRDVGPRDTKVPFLLIHQAWMTMIEYAEIQNALADLGYRSIAFDTPGYGMSDPAPGQPSIKDFADNIVALLDDLKITTVIVVGHHTGALMAASLAANHPDRVTAVILHGTPFYTPEDSAKMAASDDVDRTPMADGSHVSRWFAKTFPGDDKSQKNLDDRTWMLINHYMMGPDVGHYAVFHYDLTDDAKKIKAPTLILTDTSDSTAPFDAKLAKMRPDFTLQEFSKYSNMQMMNEPKHWAKIATEYAAKFEK